MIVRNGISGKRDMDVLRKTLVKHIPLFEQLQKKTNPEAFSKVIRSLEYDYRQSASTIMKFGIIIKYKLTNKESYFFF